MLDSWTLESVDSAANSADSTWNQSEYVSNISSQISLGQVVLGVNQAASCDYGHANQQTPE